MFALYICKTETPSLYKIGIHTGNKKTLIKRYITPLPSISIYKFYQSTERKRVLDLESRIKQKFKEHRQLNSNGNLSEWFKLNDSVLTEITEYINQKLKSHRTYNMFSIEELQEMFLSGKFVFPEYQRPIDDSRLDVIKNYIINCHDEPEYHMPEIVMNLIDGKFRIVDGQHRIMAFIRITGDDKKKCTRADVGLRSIIRNDLGIEQEKKLFININKAVSCPYIYLMKDDEKQILNDMKNYLYREFGHQISDSPRCIAPNLPINQVLDKIFVERKDGTSYIRDWYGEQVIRSPTDMCNGFYNFNGHLKNMFQSGDGFKIYKINCPKKSDKHGDQKFNQLLKQIKKKGTMRSECYLGLVDIDRICRCLFDHGKFY